MGDKGSDKTSVLIVDDEYAFCKQIEEALTMKGYDVAIATNGQQALDFIEKNSPDIMTLDMRMPGLNGYEVLEKAKWVNDKVIIIVVSAIDAPRMEESLMHAGASAVLHKPVDLNELVETINKFVS